MIFASSRTASQKRRRHKVECILQKSSGDLLDLLQWIADRRRYRLACGAVEPTLSAQDGAAADAALAELQRRGVYGTEGRCSYGC